MRQSDTAKLADMGDESAEAGAQSARARKRHATVGESVLKLIAAHVRGESSTFVEAARELVANERGKGHDDFARDLERLVDQREASLFAERRSLTPLGRSPVDDLPRDKERGLALVEIRQPTRRLEELVLGSTVLTSLERILAENIRGEVLRTHGLRPMNRILFCGVPGTGKTVTAEALATELAFPFVVVRFDAVVSSYLGETAANLRKVFDFIRGRPYVVLFDEFDAIGKSRGSSDEHGELKRVVSSFLQLLDGYRGHSLLIAATNYEGLLDGALWRRFDEVVIFEKPTTSAIEEMLLRGFRQVGLAASVRVSTIAKRLTGLAHAAVERIIDDAVKTTLLLDEPTVSEESLRSAIDRQLLREAPTSDSTLTHRKSKSATRSVKPQKQAMSRPRAKSRRRGSR